MAVYLLVLCVFCQAIITTSLGATLPVINLETVVQPTKLLPLPPTGKTLPSSPTVPSRASDILTEYLKSRNLETDLLSPSSPTGITLSSLPQVPSRETDVLSNYLIFQYPKNVLSSTLSSAEKKLLLSPKLPSKASDVLLYYFKTQYPTTDSSLPFNAPLKIEPMFSSTSSACSNSLTPPSKLYDTQAFSAILSPSSLPVVDIYKKTASKTYQPIYPPISTLPSLKSLYSSSVTSLPKISSEALKGNVDSLNQISKFAYPLYFPSISPISEDKFAFGSLPSVNLKYSLPYPLQYTLQSLPKVVTPPVSLNLSSPKYAPNRQLYNQLPLPKLNSDLVNSKSNSFSSKTALKAPFSTKIYLKTSGIGNPDQTLTTDPIYPLQDKLVINPVEPFPFNNLEILSSIGSQNARPVVPHNVPIKITDGFRCIPYQNASDGVKNINLNPNILKTSNFLPRFSNLNSGTEIWISDIAPVLSSEDKLIPNTADISIPNAAIFTQSIPNVSSSTTQYVLSYTQIIPANYLNLSPLLSPSVTSPSSSVSDTLFHILYSYMPYLISTRKKSSKSAKILPLNPYSAPKHIQTSSISLNPKLTLPIYSLTTKSPMTIPLVSASVIQPFGPTTMDSQCIDMASYCYDYSSPSFITYSPVITQPISQVTPLVPLTVTWLPSETFVDYSPSQLCSYNLPSSVPHNSYSEFYSPITFEPPIAQVKCSDKSKSMEKLLEFVCLAELIKGKGSVDWDAIEMALALLSAIQ